MTNVSQKTGIIDKLLPGDVILDTEVSHVAEAVGMVQTQLYLPAFTKDKEHLSALEVE